MVAADDGVQRLVVLPEIGDARVIVEKIIAQNPVNRREYIGSRAFIQSKASISVFYVAALYFKDKIAFRRFAGAVVVRADRR